MKNRLIFTILFIGLISRALPQTMECHTAESSGQDNPPEITLCTTPGNYVPAPYPEFRPIVTLNVNIHFFQHLDGSGNFTATGDGKGGSYTGYQYAQDLINECNNKLTNNCDWEYYPNNQTVPSGGPIQIRFELYNDPSNPSDQGVYFHQVEDQYYYYSTNFDNHKSLFSVNGEQVIDIWIQEHPNPTYLKTGGVAEDRGNGGDELKLTNVWRLWPNTGPEGYAGLTNHEVGHLLGLGHAWTNTPCPKLINQNDWNVDNNVMNYNPLNCNWTTCQLGYCHEYLTNYLPSYVAPDWCTFDPSKTIVINPGQNIVWNSSRYLYGDIVLESGSHLTIQCNVYLAQDARIIVKQNALLTIDGGKISSNCGQMWTGIEVWGDSDEHQYILGGVCEQGHVEIINGSVIENAYNAITLWKPGDFQSTGGYVTASNSTFKNNRRAVEFMAYHNYNPYHPQIRTSNFSYFTNCDFITDDSYLGPGAFYAFISMWEVEGVKINGCRFKNLKTFTNNSNRGDGLRTIDAKFNVGDYCSSPYVPCPQNSLIRSEFEGLLNGINSSKNLFVQPVYVNHAVFKDNGCGIKLKEVDYASIIFNDFYIGPNTNCPDFTGIGVEFTICNGYTIEENNFTYSNSWPIGENFIGIRVKGPDGTNNVPYNEIYRNNFTGITTGNLAEGINGTFLPNNWDGLCYICNQNQSNVNYDFYVSGTGIAMYQGTLQSPAGNVFSHTGNNPANDINNLATWPILYTYFNGNPGGPGNPGEMPIYYSSNVYLSPTSVENQCLSHFGTSNPDVKLSNEQIMELEQQITDNSQGYEDVLALYNALKDGGNTQLKEFEIISSNSSQTMELRDALIIDSPHLSCDVLKTAIDRYEVLPDAILFEILAANPDELRNEELIIYLAEREPPFPDYMIEMLKEIAGGSSVKTVMQKQMATFSANRTKAIYTLIRDFFNDTEYDFTTFENRLDNLHNIYFDYNKIDLWLQQGNTSSAMDLINSLPQLYEMDENAQTEYDLYKSLKTVQTDLVNEGKTIYELTSEQYNVLDNIAEYSAGVAGVQARNILSFVYAIEYPDCPQAMNPNMPVGDKKGSGNLPNGISEPKVTVFPNPAREWTAFSYILPKISDNAMLKIVDMHGKVITTFPVTMTNGLIIWDIRDNDPGVYFYNLTNGGYSTSGKIAITK